MKNLIIASSSAIHRGEYLGYLKDEIAELFSAADEIIFIPYARPGGIPHDVYTEKVAETFHEMNKKLIGLHTFENPSNALQNAKGIFTGGGNTFVLVSQLHKNNVMETLREAVFKGAPYLGTSAGSNICGINMQTTNDMPIVYPPSFKTLGVIPFNLNPHYLDPDLDSNHMGETRETRIKEFHTQSNIPVIGLREGSWLRVKGENIVLKGGISVRLFEQGKDPVEIVDFTGFINL